LTVTIYHNPRCSKSRQTLALLHDNDIEPDIIEYLETPPNSGELKSILGMLNMGPRDILRAKEAKEEGIDGLDGDALIDAIVAHPRALQRPIVVTGGQARVGRPPESVLEII